MWRTATVCCTRCDPLFCLTALLARLRGRQRGPSCPTVSWRRVTSLCLPIIPAIQACRLPLAAACDPPPAPYSNRPALLPCFTRIIGPFIHYDFHMQHADLRQALAQKIKAQTRATQRRQGRLRRICLPRPSPAALLSPHLLSPRSMHSRWGRYTERFWGRGGSLTGVAVACAAACKQQRLGGGARLPKRHLQPFPFRRQARHLRNLDAEVQEVGHLPGGRGDPWACACCRLGWKACSHPATAPRLFRPSTSCSLAPRAVPPVAAAPCRTCSHPVASPPAVMLAFRGSPGDAGAAHGGRPAKGVSCRSGLGQWPPAAARCRPPACILAARLLPFCAPSCAPAAPLPHLHRTTLLP